MRYICNTASPGARRDVPLFVEHCEAVATAIDVKLRWLGEQARRGVSFLSGALPGRHVALEDACEPSVVGSLWLLPAWRLRSSAYPANPARVRSMQAAGSSPPVRLEAKTKE